MRTVAILATTILLLLFVAAAPAYPQDDTKPSQQQEDKDKGKAAKPDQPARPEEAKPGQEQAPARQEPRKDEERKPNDNRQPETSRPQERPTQDMEHGHQQQRVQAQRGKRIPDEKFRASFGRQHRFHVERSRIVNNPQPVVVYGGYSFELVDAWPVEWAFDDDVYVDYVDDGYYLFDSLHPGIRIAVIVVE